MILRLERPTVIGRLQPDGDTEQNRRLKIGPILDFMLKGIWNQRISIMDINQTGLKKKKKKESDFCDFLENVYF